MSAFRAAPLASCLLLWVVGIVYRVLTSYFVDILKKQLPPEVLYFVWDPEDPNYDPVQDVLETSIGQHLALLATPSLFPLKIRLSDPLMALPVELFLFHVCYPFTIKNFRPRAALQTVLRHCFSVVGHILGLLEFLLPREHNQNNQASGATHESYQQHPQGRFQVRPLIVGFEVFQRKLYVFTSALDFERYIFAIKIVSLLIGAEITVVFFNATMLLLPILLGRRLLSAMAYFPIVRYNDLHAFCVGFHIIWAVVAGIGYGTVYFKQHNAWALPMHLMARTLFMTKSCVPLFLWVKSIHQRVGALMASTFLFPPGYFVQFVVIPSLVGLLFELLVVIPLSVPIEKSPIFLLYQDWALGLAILKIGTRMVSLRHVATLIDERWRLKLERVNRDGFAHLQGPWIMREIVLPILVQLLSALCVPYACARGLFPALGIRATMHLEAP
ncbi:hypothetical protein GOP47_0014284 [Adiantum capillus-veneris]|uniref:RING-type E3 ubiquitin transferase n=1 Tax=Adiantum capillus-veneris TaxID=13818 RepID=A0A9D4ZEQ2_ADICA|nr:hypothetical protein GOP47_0014284 [Adiantum capillus-veneris]